MYDTEEEYGPLEGSVGAPAKSFTPIPGSINGSSSAYLRWLQTSLNQAMNAGLNVNGRLDRYTAAAICGLQQSRGLLVDRNVNAETEAALAITNGTLPPGATSGATPTPPVPIMRLTSVSSAFVAAVAPTEFHNSTEINNWFRIATGSDFLDWFNNRIAGHGYWRGVRIGLPGSMAKTRTRFNNIWDRISDMFGTPRIHLFQFLSLMSIIINETRSLAPRSEKVGLRGHPGIASAFDAIPARNKASYNQRPNRSAFSLFNDPEFLAAHGHLRLADRVRNTTDPRWRGTQYPQGFPTSVNPDESGIILQADFYKFRGRGLIQTTFRNAYKQIIEYIQANAIAHPVIEEYRRRWTDQTSETVATVTSNDDWDLLFQQSDLIVPVIGIRLHSRNNGNYLNLPLDAAVLNSTARGSIWNVGRRVSGSQCYGFKFKSRVIQALNGLGNE